MYRYHRFLNQLVINVPGVNICLLVVLTDVLLRRPGSEVRHLVPVRRAVGGGGEGLHTQR